MWACVSNATRWGYNRREHLGRGGRGATNLDTYIEGLLTKGLPYEDKRDELT